MYECGGVWWRYVYEVLWYMVWWCAVSWCVMVCGGVCEVLLCGVWSDKVGVFWGV